MGYTALLFCPDDKTARTVTQVLSDLEFAVEACIEPFAAVKKLMGTHFDAVVVDCDNEQNATLLFKSARNSTSNQTSLAVAVVEGQAGVAKAFRIGANLVLTKPINIEQAKGTLRVARGLLRKSDPGKPAAAGAAPAATAAVPAATPTAASAPAAGKPAPPRTIPAAKPAPPKPAAPAPATNSPLPPRPVAATPAKTATTQAWPAAAASARPAAKDDDVLGIDGAETKAAPAVAAPKVEKPVPAAEVKPAFAASAVPTSGGGAASAPAPAREPEHTPTVAEKPAVAAPSEPSAYVGAAPTFSFGGAVGEPESSGGKKKIFIGIAAAVVVVAVAIFGFTQWKSHSAATPATEPAAPSTATTTLPKPSAQPPAAATPAASTPAEAPAATSSNDDTESAAEPAKPAAPKSSKASSAATAAESKPAEPAEDEPAPMVVKGGKVTSKTDSGTGDAPAAPSMVGMATPGAAPIPLVGGTSPEVQPMLQTLSISQGVSQGLLYHKVAPVYPQNAIRMQIEGEVQLQATISKDGDISKIKAVSGAPQLTKAAIDAVKQWKYKPYLLNGEPVEIQTTVTVNFKLPH
jgi:TonB family protein